MERLNRGQYRTAFGLLAGIATEAFLRIAVPLISAFPHDLALDKQFVSQNFIPIKSVTYETIAR